MVYNCSGMGFKSSIFFQVVDLDTIDVGDLKSGEDAAVYDRMQLKSKGKFAWLEIFWLEKSWGF